MNPAVEALGHYLLVFVTMMAIDLTMQRFPAFARRIGWPVKREEKVRAETDALARQLFPDPEKREEMKLLSLMFVNALMAIPMTGALYLVVWLLQ